MSKNYIRKAVNKKRRAFTIVELVIVIAVIAILAAVLIPTFVNLVKASKIAGDTQTARNMNTALALAQATDGKNNTFYEAVQDIAEAGYELEKLTPTAEGFDLCWDQEKDQMVLLDGNTATYPENYTVDKSKLWVVVHDNDEFGAKTTDFNVYLADNFTTTTLSPKFGIDVGNNTNITAINYSNSNSEQNVVIRTNSYDTVLTINAEKDTVKHFDKANKINVEAVAMHSYHEFGDVLGNIKLEKGNVVVEEGCKASAIVIDATAAELATVTTLSADNSKAPEIPIILNTTEYAWSANEHNDLIDPEKNNIIYAKTAAAGKETSTDPADMVDGVAAIGTTVYASFIDAYNAARNNDTITLLKNADCPTAPNTKINLTINLNDKTLTCLSKNAYYVSGNNTLTYKNGKLVMESEGSANACLSASTGAELRLINIDLNCLQGAAVYPDGTASRIYIETSKITTAGAYGIGTNRSESHAVKIDIVNSEVNAPDGSAVFINTTANVDIKDSKILGNVHGLLVRIGNVNVENTIIETNETEPSIFSYKAFADGYGFAPKWSGGNALPAATVVLGDYSDNAVYSGAVNVSFKNVKLISADINEVPNVVCGAKLTTTEVKFDYDADSTIGKLVIYGEDAKLADQIIHNGSIVINGKNALAK